MYDLVKFNIIYTYKTVTIIRMEMYPQHPPHKCPLLLAEDGGMHAWTQGRRDGWTGGRWGDGWTVGGWLSSPIHFSPLSG